jgi:hypothetical protein
VRILILLRLITDSLKQWHPSDSLARSSNRILGVMAKGKVAEM